MIRRPRLRSLRNKLALVFFAITATAFAAIYFYVVPQLESKLRERTLSDLARQAAEVEPQLQRGLHGDVRAGTIVRLVRAVSDSTDARVTLFNTTRSVSGRQSGGLDLRFGIRTDSSEQRAYPRNDSLARRAVLSGHLQRGLGSFQGERFVQVAQPLSDGTRGQLPRVVLYSRDLEAVTEAVKFTRQRVLLATAAALLLALIGGYLVARALARRVRRLEVAAAEVARGRFIEPLPVDSEDELGQLTRTFNEMQERLRQLDVARKEFIATASHELRTPIFSLAGFVELLQDEDLDEETHREFIETMSEQVARLQKLSVDLLDLSRLDAGSLQLQTEPVDLTELARSVVSEFGPALADHGTELQVDLPRGGVEARCDRERVVQIMRILLDNALQHTPDGTQVSVSAGADNGCVELSVADGGPGMGEAVQAKAFERFYTGDATRGAGLGLAIARELAECMQGELQVRSEPGATTFTLALPREPDVNGSRP
jgi:two-component system, OmpR family, sensor kinase